MLLRLIFQEGGDGMKTRIIPGCYSDKKSICLGFVVYPDNSEMYLYKRGRRYYLAYTVGAFSIIFALSRREAKAWIAEMVIDEGKSILW